MQRKNRNNSGKYLVLVLCKFRERVESKGNLQFQQLV